MISISVPGKIHLLGEHSVVFGKPALLAAINLKVHLKLIPLPSLRSKTNDVSLRGAESYVAILFNSDSGLSQNDKRLKLLRKTIENTIKQKLAIKNIPPYKMGVNSQLPIGSGLGSSAAISVALTKALLKFLKLEHDKNLIYEIALEGEKIFHGNPSGADIWAVLLSGLIFFQKESITKVQTKFMKFLLIDSGKPVESTKEMAAIVARQFNPQSSLRGAKRRGNLVQKILDDQEKLTIQLAQALKNGDEKILMDCIKKGEKNLEKLGVVSKKAQNIIRRIENLGGAAKISGAGGIKNGSGMILTYHKNPKKVLDFAKKNNLKAFKIKIGEKGLKSEG